VRREVLKVLHVQRGERQLGDNAAGRDPRVIDRPGTTALLSQDAELAPLPRNSLVVGQDHAAAESGHELSPGAGSPLTLLRPAGQLADGHECYAYLVPGQPGGQRRRQPALVTQRCDIGVEDDPRHRLGHVLVPELVQVSQELLQLLV